MKGHRQPQRSESDASCASSAVPLVMMESTNSIRSSDCYGDHDHRDMRAHQQHPFYEMRSHSGVRVHVRRARILIAAVLLVAIVVVLMWLCANDGIRLETFAAGDKDDDERSQLLDKYNSYSGNVASVIIKPLDFFVAMVVAVGVFTCATDASLGANTSWVSHATMLATAIAGYLLSNGFNAVNVQLAPRPVELWITPADLSASAASSATSLTEKLQIKALPFEATANKSLVEESERNPLANTALRGLVESMQSIPNNQCTHFRGYTQSRWNSIVASYGFQQRAWHNNALREAVKPSAEIKFALRDTLSAKPQALPMGTTRAMRLVIQSMMVTEKLLPWWEDKYSLNVVSRPADVAIKRKFNETLPRGVKRTNHSVSASMNELLFNASATGSPEGAAVLASTQALLKTMFGEVKNISTPGVEVSFSRTNLSRGIYYDSITFEIPLVKQYLHRRLQLDRDGESYLVISTTNSSGTGNRTSTATVTIPSDADAYYDIDIGAGCSTNGCIVEEKEYDMKGRETSIEAQVHATAVCADESIRVTYREDALNAFFNSSFVSYNCSAASNTSLYTVSLGKRIEGEEIALNAKDAGLVTLKNARKVYSITVGMLVWESENLADAYGATCEGGNATKCSGLRFELDTTAGSPKQHLLLGASRVPTSLLFKPDFYRPSLLKLTQLVSIAPTQICATCKGLMADMVVPRRFKSVKWPAGVPANTSNQCSKRAEDYLALAETNHLYIEKSLQPAYTSGLFYLFQDGVARNVIAVNKSSSATTTASSSAVADGATLQSLAAPLAFASNRQLVDVKLSSPAANIGFTLAGAAIILVLAVVVTIRSPTTEAKFQRDASAHNVAEVLINGAKFPPLLLEKTLLSADYGVQANIVETSAIKGDSVKATGGTASAIDLEGFLIESVVLAHPDGRTFVLPLASKGSIAV